MPSWGEFDVSLVTYWARWDYWPFSYQNPTIVMKILDEDEWRLGAGDLTSRPTAPPGTISNCLPLKSVDGDFGT